MHMSKICTNNAIINIKLVPFIPNLFIKKLLPIIQIRTDIIDDVISSLNALNTVNIRLMNQHVAVNDEITSIGRNKYV